MEVKEREGKKRKYRTGRESRKGRGVKGVVIEGDRKGKSKRRRVKRKQTQGKRDSKNSGRERKGKGGKDRRVGY